MVNSHLAPETPPKTPLSLKAEYQVSWLFPFSRAVAVELGWFAR